MGTGISMAAMNAGFDVIMVEQNDDAIQKAKAKINSTYDRSVKLNRISTEQKQQFMDSSLQRLIFLILKIET
jgi:3-hydroxyacyl-CoA dehydrogenase